MHSQEAVTGAVCHPFIFLPVICRWGQSELPACLFISRNHSHRNLTLNFTSWWVHLHKQSHNVNMCCVLLVWYLIVCIYMCVLCVLCKLVSVCREPTVPRLSDNLNNLSLLSFLSLNHRWGCSSGTQRDRNASGASSPVIYATRPLLWWSMTLQVSTPLYIFNTMTYTALSIDFIM